jgi:hypothetical protein
VTDPLVYSWYNAYSSIHSTEPRLMSVNGPTNSPSPPTSRLRRDDGEFLALHDRTRNHRIDQAPLLRALPLIACCALCMHCGSDSSATGGLVGPRDPAAAATGQWGSAESRLRSVLYFVFGPGARERTDGGHAQPRRRQLRLLDDADAGDEGR